MFITPAYAETGVAAGPDMLMQFAPLIIVFAIMYFLFMRPQQQKQKQHREMLANVRRGDTVVLGGGLIGKVSKVSGDAEVEVEIADGVKVRVVRGMIAEVRAKGEPVKESA
jgi:preprotein translocase subunit YajC